MGGGGARERGAGGGQRFTSNPKSRRFSQTVDPLCSFPCVDGAVCKSDANQMQIRCKSAAIKPTKQPEKRGGGKKEKTKSVNENEISAASAQSFDPERRNWGPLLPIDGSSGLARADAS